MKKRPFRILLLCLIFAGLAVFGVIRVQQSLQTWTLSATLAGFYFPIYALVSGAFWSLAGIIGLVGLWTRQRWASTGAWGAAIFYPAAYWLEKIAVLKSPTRFTNWPFAAGVTVFWLLFVFVVLNMRRK